jgi:hypothetical protein
MVLTGTAGIINTGVPGRPCEAVGSGETQQLAKGRPAALLRTYEQLPRCTILLSAALAVETTARRVAESIQRGRRYMCNQPESLPCSDVSY